MAFHRFGHSHNRKLNFQLFEGLKKTYKWIENQGSSIVELRKMNISVFMIDGGSCL